jgi:hypothetical protein
MPIDYAAEQKQFVKFKSALTRAQSTRDPQKVLVACDAFFHYYALPDKILPDAWHRWQRAQEDALLARELNRRSAW